LKDELLRSGGDEFGIQVRIGVHYGDVVAGVVGKKQPVLLVCFLQFAIHCRWSL
jgi:class 3 adenylate cyclase